MLFQNPWTVTFHQNAHDNACCDIHRGTPPAHFTICLSLLKSEINSHTSLKPNANLPYTSAFWNNSLIHPDHNLHRFYYSWNHNHNTDLREGYISKLINICNNARPLFVKVPAGRWKRHWVETGHSLLKGSTDLLMLAHLKVTSFLHAFRRHHPISVCTCGVCP